MTLRGQQGKESQGLRVQQKVMKGLELEGLLASTLRL
jgi:hypothetical protein